MLQRGVIGGALIAGLLFGGWSGVAKADMELARASTDWESSKDWSLAATYGFYTPSCYSDIAEGAELDDETQAGCEAMSTTYGTDGFRHLGLRLGYVIIEQIHVDIQAEFLKERARALGEESLIESGALTTLNLVNGNFGITARLDFFDEQILVPYGRFGLTASLFKETVDDGGDEEVVMGDRYGYYGAIGLELLLDRFEPDRAADLDISQGINDTSIFIESRMQSLQVGQDVLPFSGIVVTGGLKFEF